MRWMWPLFLVVSLAQVAAADTAPDVSAVKLRGLATVYGESVTLADVLVFPDTEAKLLRQVGDEPAVAKLPAQGKVVITHEQIVRRLDELHVNLGQVLVCGALACEVTLTRPAASNGARQVRGETVRLTGDTAGTRADGEYRLAADTTVTPRGSSGKNDARGGKTLGDVLRAHINDELSQLGGTAELQFERAGQEFLELTTPPFEFGVSASGKDKLGLREFRVVIRQDGRVQRTAQISAQVRLVRPVVVARRPLSIGNYVRAEDVGLETRVFESAARLGPTSVEEVLGQQVKRFIPSGETVAHDALKAVDLVERSRPVTVLGAGSNVQMRLTGVALDNGSYGDTVRVRLGDARTSRQQLRGVVTGVGTVRLAEGNP